MFPDGGVREGGRLDWNMIAVSHRAAAGTDGVAMSRGRGLSGQIASVLLAMLVVFVRPASAQTPLLLADDTKQPHVTISWPTKDGKTVTLEGDRPYRSPGDKAPIGKNVECYVALGGTRLDRGQANGKGAIVRVGLYKIDTAKPFFEDIAGDGVVTIKLDRVFMNQPASPRPKTGMMHLRYMLDDLKACGLDAKARNLFVTVDPQDAIQKGVAPDSGRFGALDGRGTDHGSFAASVEADGSTSMVLKFPYSILRHTKDPNQRTQPGTFFEPQHFHAEMELLPKAMAEEQDAAEKAAAPNEKGERPAGDRPSRAPGKDGDRAPDRPSR